MEPTDIQVAGYELKREIGSGGMARVFLATQLSLGREVAIKVMRKDLAVSGGEDLQRRFLHEGQMLAKLVHPNIVAIYDINQTDEVSYMAMEYLKGGTLGEKIKEGLSIAQVIRITTQVAHALGLAHENHIVHRDLKPDNIMFRDELTPVLTDFGIAKKTDAEHSLTKTGMVVGTPYYMSPEQITGKTIDGRSDIYSLGIMFYELLAGELPFRAEEPLALAMQHVQEPPPPLPENVHELQPVVDALLAKNADDRFDDMLEFCQAVKELVMDEPTLQEKLSGETQLFNSDQFTDPRFGTSSGRRVSRLTQGGARTSASRRKPPSDATAVMQSGAQPKRGGGLGWKLPAAITLVLVAALVSAYFAFFSKPPSGLSEQDQRVVDNLMERAQGFIDTGQYEAPPGRNAIEMLKQVFTIDPNYSDALEAAEDIAEIYEADATIALRMNEIETAQQKIAVGLSISPEYEGLISLKQDIDSRLAEAERLARIDTLIATAAQQLEDGKRIDPEGDNAYATYRTVLELDGANQTARQALDQIQTWMAGNVRSLVDNGQLEEAGALLTRAESMFAQTTVLAQIRNEIDQALTFRRETAEINDLLAAAQEQFTAERYVYPPDDNALESYLAVLSVRPTQADAIAGLDRIAKHFEALARTAADGGDYAGSLDHISNGLRAQPDNATLLAMQDQATDRLGAAAREIEQLLQTAERLVQSGQFLSGDNGGALATYQAVLDKSPGNSRAMAAISRLPDQIFAVAQQMRRDNNYRLADLLLTEAVAQYPDQARFATLKEDVGQLLAEQDRRQRLAQLLAESERLVDVRPVTRASFDAAADKIKAILEDYPNEVQVRAQLSELTSALAQEANRISEAGNHDAAFRLIEHGLAQFEGNRALADANATVRARQQAAIEAEERRLAALRGQLAIDASPWGEVTEVKDANGNLASLPSDATTPIVLTLTEGQYEVTIRGANNTSQRLNVSVERQNLVATRAEFESMSADRYFETSGW